jgi:hypothetical protein
MTESGTKEQYKSLTKVSLSILIFSILSLQFSMAFLRFCPENRLKSLCPRIPDDPAFYPFLDYPMYAGAMYEGVQVDQYFLFGVLEDGTEIPISEQEIQISRYNFIRKILPKIQDQNLMIIQEYVKIYEKNSQKNLVKLRLENHPLVITREGVNPKEKIVIVDLKV